MVRVFTTDEEYTDAHFAELRGQEEDKIEEDKHVKRAGSTARVLVSCEETQPKQ
jgi:hypothetical protein